MNKIDFFEHELPQTPIQKLSDLYSGNSIYMKRDDLLPFSFGGNKVRKAAEFYKEIQNSETDVIMTYGSNSSNHCRIIANMAASMGIPCHIISPSENRTILYNTSLVEKFGATIETCPVNEVAATIEKRKKAYRDKGFKPYFIVGGGHGNPGTEAYVKAYKEIKRQESEKGIRFDYIFHASGTGATQAGLVCGQLLDNDIFHKIVGISIAREGKRGREVVLDSIKEYLRERFEQQYRDEDLIFEDQYRCGGYGNYTNKIQELIDQVMLREGIPMDATYVGKAFWGMCEYLRVHEICGKNILFLHTGGTPLYFDCLKIVERYGN